jgi:tetratricopeptide (TPR) repeat protein
MKASKSVRYLCQAVFALGSVLAAGIPAHGQEIDQDIPGYPNDVRYGYDPRELALLPRYCIYTQLFRDNVPGGNDSAEIKRWYSVMGGGFHHMHHYCWGLMKTNRALFLVHSQRYRTFYLSSAIAEFNYVIRMAPPDFKMLPEIFTKKGENLIRLDKGPEGILEFQRAIELKPDYWPPYAAMSDYYSKIGDLAKAREWLEQGLSASPNTKALTRRLAELDAPQSKRKAEPPAER